MEYKIFGGNYEVTICSLGAEILSAKYNGVERIWQNDNNTWKYHAPLLFPVCGKAKVTTNGVTSNMPSHGIARISEFDLISHKDNYVEFKLSSNEDAFKEYPYNFILYVSYEIKDDSLIISYDVENKNDYNMYFSIGGHTSFRLLDKISKYDLDLKDDTELYSINLTDGLRDGSKEKVSDNGLIDLSSKLLDNSETIIIDSLKSKEALLKNKDGSLYASIKWDNFKYLLLWHPVDSKMVCIEPWNNLPDKSLDLVEYKDKDGIIELKKNEHKTFKQIIKYNN